LGQMAGRKKKSEITLFKTVGIAVYNVVTAQRVYTKALEQGIGTET
jgi:ornithine cyclodeaminase